MIILGLCATVLMICYVGSIICAADEKREITKIQDVIAGLTLSASPPRFVPPSTPPIPTSMVSPYREPFIRNVSEKLSRRFSKSPVFIRHHSQSHATLPLCSASESLCFEKILITEKVIEEKKESPLLVSVDCDEDETFFPMGDEE